LPQLHLRVVVAVDKVEREQLADLVAVQAVVLS
jgi:hypothetical protein